jgi:rRNA maturation protein Rpf1
VILVTTGRNPTQSTRRLCKELTRFIPNTRRMVRGKLGLRQLPDKLVSAESDRMIVVYRGFGGPSQLGLVRLEGGQLKKIPPTIMLQSAKLEPTRKRHSSKVECITADSKDALHLGEVFSEFLELPLADYKTSNFKHSLHISGDARRVLTIAPIHLQTGQMEGFSLIAKKLQW